jgi:8-oxo-dGTP pyrophosphatase MutT (NUDIX family)
MTDDKKPSKEQRILLTMRKVLAAIVKDTAPSGPGMRSVLNETTIEDIRQCFGLISARERELSEELGIDLELLRPRYADEPKTTAVVSMDSLKKSISKGPSDKGPKH